MKQKIVLAIDFNVWIVIDLNFHLQTRDDCIMGYSTYFYGFWTLTPALSLAQTDYLQKFSRTRRVKRDPDAIKNNRRLAAIGLHLGVDAEYFIDTEDEDESILDINQPPGSQPSLWCKWRVNDKGDSLTFA